MLTGHNHYVMCASFHPSEDLIVSASLDQVSIVGKHAIEILRAVLTRILCIPTVRLSAFGTRPGSGRNSSVEAGAWISRACKKMGPAETQGRPLLLRPL